MLTIPLLLLLMYFSLLVFEIVEIEDEVVLKRHGSLIDVGPCFLVYNRIHGCLLRLRLNQIRPDQILRRIILDLLKLDELGQILVELTRLLRKSGHVYLSCLVNIRVFV